MIQTAKEYTVNSSLRTYQAWADMKYRCTNEGAHNYKNYGGRGITVCNRWLESFDNFFVDMGNVPLSQSLDRKDNSLGYFPENCRWATYEEQNNNKRNNRYITYGGTTLTMAQWARKVGLTYRALSGRMNHPEWTIERALTTPQIHT